MDKEFAELLASRILYQLTCRDLIKIQGNTVDKTNENLRQARIIAMEMMVNGQESPDAK